MTEIAKEKDNMKKFLSFVGKIVTLAGLILAILGTMYEILPESLRYSCLIGLFLAIWGGAMLGASSEYPNDDILS